MNNSTSVLSAQNLSICLGNKKILEHVNFSAGQGEFIGIIGPNGAGKSTLLKGLRRLLPLATGTVIVLDEVLERLSDRKLAKSVAYMQQEIDLDFQFTALEVVLAGRYPYLKWWENESDEDVQIARKYMAFTGVDYLADKVVQHVSGGERQRILLAKVLAQETPLLFLDEPTASLDLVYQEEIFRYCQVMCQEGKTVLMVAHDLKLAAKFCTRLMLVAQGTILADDQPSAVITKENLQQAYGLHSTVFTNEVTGNLDIHTYAATGVSRRQEKVHVIGGGGSAGNLVRLLHEKSYSLSGGVFQYGDTDAHVAQAFGVDCVLGQPFCVNDEAFGRQNREKIAQADWVVLSNLYYGAQNLDNLKAAFSAKKLIVIEESPLEQRDFTGGEATRLYGELVALPQVTVMTWKQFIRQLENDHNEEI
ncbi:iron complex transport system ATP-binding protein [Sporomusaceae bacterium BoRhaA]|uniref:ABC transporter ATP-binding protein n=1 Tax=Pelorhabdus rhamnosifermentans TaxID=2772457 RepID=UPI001C06480B|nr:ABC transporter ATP-binding protein [Pelorhabdus rhamnosifermentans]MBU2702757.1 iron complex transport system ATP-binding protein [Pelorhabdus rhamnosifermentans]